MVHRLRSVEHLIVAQALHLFLVHSIEHAGHLIAFQFQELVGAHGINHIQCAGATKVRESLSVHVGGDTERALRSEGFEAIAFGHFQR